jgi:hypothetical protein
MNTTRRHRLSAVSTAVTLRSVALVIGLIGAGALVWNVATDDPPSRNGDQFERIDAYVRDERTTPGISIAIVDADETVHAAGFGEDGQGNDITADTPFWIGSNTKSMTALAVRVTVAPRPRNAWRRAAPPARFGHHQPGICGVRLGSDCACNPVNDDGLSGGDIECLTAPVGGLRLPRRVLAGAAAHDASEVLLSTMETSRAIRALRSSQNDTM